jgi:uncharacterized protein with GYD domain
MATYIALLRYTQKGLESIKDSPDRLVTDKHTFRAMGGELREFYLLMGHYDIINIVEAPDDETMAKIALTISERGTVQVEVIRAFSEEQYRKIIADLPQPAPGT